MIRKSLTVIRFVIRIRADWETGLYIHELPEWPHFTWDTRSIAGGLSAVRLHQGELLGKMHGYGMSSRWDATLKALTEETIKSSAIEGVVELMLDATQNYEAPLNDARLFGWHNSLFPGGYSGLHKIRVAAWRDA